MGNITARIADVLYENGIIKYEDIEGCRYGLEIFLSSVLEILSIIIISAFIGVFWQTVLFFAAFIPLRLYTGGYHAKTRFGCFVILIVVYILFNIIINYTPENIYKLIAIISILFSAIVIGFFAPVINGKRINKSESRNYKKISFFILFLEALIILGMVVCFENKYFFSFVIGELTVVLSMLPIIVKNILNSMKGVTEYQKNK